MHYVSLSKAAWIQMIKPIPTTNSTSRTKWGTKKFIGGLQVFVNYDFCIVFLWIVVSLFSVLWYCTAIVFTPLRRLWWRKQFLPRHLRYLISASCNKENLPGIEDIPTNGNHAIGIIWSQNVRDWSNPLNS